MIHAYEVTFQQADGEVFLRSGGVNIIEIVGAGRITVEADEWFQYFGNFIIVRRSTGAFKKIINSLTELALSFDGVTVQIVTSTQPNILGFGELFDNSGTAFYTTSVTLIAQIDDALEDPGDLPTPPPEQGTLGLKKKHNYCTW